MRGEGTPRRRQRRGAGACDGAGLGRGTGRAGGRGGLGTRTATRALVAVGAYVAQDLRDPDGVTRPLLRRVALRMVASPRKAVRSIGTAYLRSDPPTPEELDKGSQSAPRQLGPGESAVAPDAAARAPSDASAPD